MRLDGPDVRLKFVRRGPLHPEIVYLLSSTLENDESRACSQLQPYSAVRSTPPPSSTCCPRELNSGSTRHYRELSSVSMHRRYDLALWVGRNPSRSLASSSHHGVSLDLHLQHLLDCRSVADPENRFVDIIRYLSVS
jgi:hypothetical protein